jgi:hypothetical protein
MNGYAYDGGWTTLNVPRWILTLFSFGVAYRLRFCLLQTAGHSSL